MATFLMINLDLYESVVSASDDRCFTFAVYADASLCALGCENLSEDENKEAHGQLHVSSVTFTNAGKRDLTEHGYCHRFSDLALNRSMLNRPITIGRKPDKGH